MLQSVNVPWVRGMNFGMGVNLLNGAIAGKAVEPGTITTPTNAQGQTVTYQLTKLTSLEELYTSIGISVEASGHYGLFSADGKFAYSREVKFNSESTFLLARCFVANAFRQCEDATFSQETLNLLTENRQTEFQQRFGDGFVRGMQTGGEFHAVIAITAVDRQTQQSVGADLEAKYGGIFSPAGGEVDVELNDAEREKLKRTKLLISTFQSGGGGEQASFTSDIESVMRRLVAFPAIVEKNPVPYEAQVASYLTLPRPVGPSPIDIEAQRVALSAYARLQLRLISLQNDVEFVLQNPSFFISPPPILALNGWAQTFADQISRLRVQASTCAGSLMSEGEGIQACPAMSLALPGDFAMPQRTMGLDGAWQMVSDLGSSTWTFKLRSTNQYDATEEGLGAARGIAVLNGLRVDFDWKATVDNASGHYAFEVTRDFTSGIGTCVFFTVHTHLGTVPVRFIKIA